MSHSDRRDSAAIASALEASLGAGYDLVNEFSDDDLALYFDVVRIKAITTCKEEILSAHTQPVLKRALGQPSAVSSSH